MIQVSGTYNKGKITLDKAMAIDKPVKVMVTFMDDAVNIDKRLSIDNFSFLKSRELLKDVKVNLSDAVLEERRAAL